MKVLYPILLTVLVFVGCKQTSSKPVDINNLLLEYNQPHPPVENIDYKGLKKDDSEAYKMGMRAYKNGNYQGAFNIFYRINPKTDLIMLYEANAQLQLRAYAKSKEILAALLTITVGNTKMNAEWYMVISELGLGNTEQAKVLLNPITQNTAHPFHAKAVKLSKELS